MLCHHPLWLLGRRRAGVGLTVGVVILAAGSQAPTFGQEPSGRPSSSWTPCPSAAQLSIAQSAPALGTPAHLRIPRRESDRRPHFRIPSAARRGTLAVGAASFPPAVLRARPIVIITTPEDQAAVSAGLLRVRGTVDANDAAVGVVVNGVRAVVRAGLFVATVRVTPHTLLLSAAATTRGRVSARHQIGVTVSATGATALRLRGLPANRMAALDAPLRLLSGLTPTPPHVRAAGDGDGCAILSIRDGERLAMAPSTGAAIGAAVQKGVADAVGPLVMDELPPEAESAPPTSPPPTQAEWTERGAPVTLGREERAPAPPAGLRRFFPGLVARIATLRVLGGQDEDVPRGLRRARLGPELSLGLLFTLDANGLWRVSWF